MAQISLTQITSFPNYPMAFVTHAHHNTVIEKNWIPELFQQPQVNLDADKKSQN